MLSPIPNDIISMYRIEKKNLTGLLTGLSRKQRMANAGTFAVASAYVLVAWILVLHITDWLFVFPPQVRYILSLATLFFIAAFLLILLRKLLKPSELKKVAADIEGKRPEFKQEISTALQFSTGSAAREGYSQPLIDDLIGRTEMKLGELDENGGTRKFNPWPFGRWLAVSLLLLLGVCLLKPGELTLSVYRYVFVDSVTGDWTGIEVSPGDVRIARNSELNIEVFNQPGKVGKVEWRAGSFKSVPMAFKDGKLSAVIKDIETTGEYRIVLGRRRSRPFKIECYTPMMLTDIKVKITPPAYTGLKITEMENPDRLAAIKGSLVKITAISTLPLSDARLIWANGRWQELTTSDEGRLDGSFMVRDNGKFRLWGRDHQGDTLINPVEFSVTCFYDELPKVEISQPEPDIMLGDNRTVLLKGKAEDDFGITSASLVFLSGDGEHRLEVGRWNDRPGETLIEYPWEIGQLDVLPGDSVVYWLEARDNDTYAGPKSGKSRIQIIRIPTIEEIYRSLSGADSSIIEELGRTEQPSDMLKEEIDKLAQSLKESRKIDWQQQAAVENILQKQKELADQLEKAMEKATESLKDRENKWSFDQETIEKMAQLREIFDQVATDKMRQDMESLRQAMEKLDKKEVDRALENLKFSQEDLKRQLDQMMDMLKELRQEQLLEKLDRQIQDMIKQQQELKQNTERAGSHQNQKLSSDQKRLAEDLDRLTEETDALSHELAEANREAAARLNESNDQMKKAQTSGKMRKASEALSNNERQQASELQERALSELSALSSGLQNARGSMRRAKNQAAEKAVRQKARDLLEVSRQQESLNRLASNSAGKDDDLADNQQILKRQAERIARELENMVRENILLSPRPAQMAMEAARQMGQAAQSHYDGRSNEAKAAGNRAMASLNGAAVSLVESNPGSGSGSGDMMQDLQGLSGQQQMVNDGTGAMLSLPKEGGGQLSMQARSQMARLAAQQEAVRQGMQEFNDKFGGRRDKAGRMDDVVEEIKRVIDDLKKRKVDRRTIERQEKILTRMLEVQQSLKERDFSRERRTERGVLPEGSANAARIDRDKWDQRGMPAWKDWRKEYFPLEYKDILEEYFRSLEQ